MKTNEPMGDIDTAASLPQVPSYNQGGTMPAWKNDAIYDSSTPTSEAQDVTTSISKEDCSGDQIQAERKMTKAEQLAHRMKAFEAARPNTDTTLPDFQAGEIEYD